MSRFRYAAAFAAGLIVPTLPPAVGMFVGMRRVEKEVRGRSTIGWAAQSFVGSAMFLMNTPHFMMNYYKTTYDMMVTGELRKDTEELLAETGGDKPPPLVMDCDPHQ